MAGMRRGYEKKGWPGKVPGKLLIEGDGGLHLLAYMDHSDCIGFGAAWQRNSFCMSLDCSARNAQRQRVADLRAVIGTNAWVPCEIRWDGSAVRVVCNNNGFPDFFLSI